MAIYLVTGAAGALASVLVDTLISRGDRVAALDLPRSRERLAGEAARHGASYLPLAIDPSDAGAWADAAEQATRALGDIDGVALVAGGWRGGAPLHEEDESTYRAMFEMNVDSAYRALHALLPGMVARRRGAIVAVASRAAVQPWTSAGAAAYAASKAAVAALVQAVAAEVLASGVRVNAVMPSVIDTPQNRASMPDADPSRWVSGSSLAGVIAFLLSDAARDITGALVPVYGRS